MSDDVLIELHARRGKVGGNLSEQGEFCLKRVESGLGDDGGINRGVGVGHGRLAVEVRREIFLIKGSGFLGLFGGDEAVVLGDEFLQ